jgi:hypothetical protein
LCKSTQICHMKIEPSHTPHLSARLPAVTGE